MSFSYLGAIHIHSIHSDGTGSIEEIAIAARNAGLSWIIVTDHNNMDAKEGIYHGVYVFVGQEISPENGNHYIALNIKENVSHEIPPSEYIKEVKAQGGFGFVAHPDEKINRNNTYNPLRWSDWEMKNIGGLEIWNYMSNWADSYHEWNLFKGIISFLFRNNVLSGPTSKTLKWWDDLNNDSESIIPAIGGLDVHAFDIRKFFLKLKIFPYQNSFNSITNIIYTEEPINEDFEERKKVIYDSIKMGKNIIINRAYLGFNKKRHPIFYIKNCTKKAMVGDNICLDDSTKILIELPKKAHIKLIHNGKYIFEKKTKAINIRNITKGKYRIEAYYKGKPWIFSNPIIVK